MKQKQIEDLQTVLRIQVLMQSVLYQIDELSHSTLYRNQNKQRFENFYTYVSKLVETLTDAFNSEDKQVQKEMNSYIKITNDIEKLLNKITIKG